MFIYCKNEFCNFVGLPGKLSIVRMVYCHQSSVIFMRVWRCFNRVVRSYLRYCILTLSILFCYGICDSILYIMSITAYIYNGGKIHHLVCVDTHSLN
jgi:hypothetical protein